MRNRVVLEIEEDQSGAVTRWRARRVCSEEQFATLQTAELADRAAQQCAVAAQEAAKHTRMIARDVSLPPGLTTGRNQWSEEWYQLPEESSNEDKGSKTTATATTVITTASVITAAPVAKQSLRWHYEESLKILTDLKWYYDDSYHAESGPWTNDQMLRWLRNGQLGCHPSNLRVRLDGWKEMSYLEELFP